LTSAFQDRSGSIAGQLAIKAPCDTATTANITLSGEQTIDGVATANSRVLVKNQTDTTENGLYDTSSGAWTRTLDFDGARDAVKGTLIHVTGGTIAAGKTYRLTSASPTSFGTDVVTFAEYTVASAVTGALLQEGSNVASASTTDIGASDSDHITITGTTTITSLGSSVSFNHVWVKFGGALILTHNGTSLILPTGANITTVAGDAAEFIRISGSNWVCVNYQRADGTPVQNQFLRTEVTVASATTTTLPTTSNVILISGTTTITSFGSSASATYPIYFVRFSGALTLTHNGTSLILPSSANIATADGDAAIMLYLGSGNWKCLAYNPVDGKQVAAIAVADFPDGTIVNRNYAEYTSNSAITTVLPLDDTIPQNTEGDEVVTAALTPASATNRVRVTFTAFGASSAASGAVCAALFIDSGADAVRAVSSTGGTANYTENLKMVYEYVPGDTSSHTYKIRVGPGAAATVRLNGTSAARYFGGVAAATLVIEEIKAS
jgi:uncharacterized cupin superfamily protein